MVGDMIEGSDYPEEIAAQWEEFQEHVDRLEVPFLFLPGNRDIGTPAGAEYWRRNLGRTYSSFVHKNALFVLLNTEEVRAASGRSFGAAQVEYALAVLKDNPSPRHTFIFMHDPTWALPSYRAEWARIEQALADRPYTVFCGHWHAPAMEERNGRQYYALGPAEAHVQPNPLEPAGTAHRFALVTLDPGAAQGDFPRVSLRRSYVPRAQAASVGNR